jgi:hypothetical protein
MPTSVLDKDLSSLEGPNTATPRPDEPATDSTTTKPGRPGSGRAADREGQPGEGEKGRTRGMVRRKRPSGNQGHCDGGNIVLKFEVCFIHVY